MNITEMDVLQAFETAANQKAETLYNQTVELQTKDMQVFQKVQALQSELHDVGKEELEKIKASIESEKEKQDNFFEKMFYGRDPNRLNERIEKLTGIVAKINNFHNKYSQDIIRTFHPVWEADDKMHELQDQIDRKKKQLNKRLKPEIIQEFHHFQADQQLAGERCAVCLGDVTVGKSMVRLDCEGRHVFCQPCVEGWFAAQNTCPKCRHVFA